MRSPALLPAPRHPSGDTSTVALRRDPPRAAARAGRGALAVALALLAATVAPSAVAGECCRKAPSPAAAVVASALPAGSIYQLETAYTTDTGQPFRLAALRGRPVVLAMFFASCNYACPLIVADLTRLHAALPAPLRDEVAIVLVSFDVARDTPEVLAKYRAERLLGPQWILLRGDDDAVAELAALLGVKYKQEADGQFAHSNLFTILDREGEVVHQRAGLQGGLPEAAAALVARVR